MGMGLKLDAPSLNDESGLKLARELDLQQDNVNLDKSIEKVGQLADGAMRCLPKEEQALIKKEISEFAYKNSGNLADIQSLHYNVGKNQVSATIDFAHQVTVNLDELGFSKSPEVKELLGQVQAMEKEHQQLEKNCGHLGSMINKAVDNRKTNITQREQEIHETSQGVKGLWNQLSGNTPKPYPTLEERPLTREDITNTLHVQEVKTDHFLKLLNERLPDIQQDPQIAIQNLDNLLNKSREKLDNLSLQASSTLNVTKPNNSIDPLVNQSDIELPPVKPREITDAELAQLNKELDQLSDYYTIPSREITNKDADDLTQSLRDIDNQHKSLSQRAHEVITENLKVDTGDDSLLADIKRSTASGIAIMEGGYDLGKETIEGLYNLAVHGAIGVGTGYTGLADAMTGGYLSANFEFVQHANEYNVQAHAMATNITDATMPILADVQLSQEGFMDASDRTYERMNALNGWTNNHLQNLSMSYSTGDIEGMRGTGKLAIDGALTLVPMFGTTKLSKLNKIDDLVDIAHGVDTARTIDRIENLRGFRTKIPENSTPENIRSILRENESAEILAKSGYDVFQNPNKIQLEEIGYPKAGIKEPDYIINGEVFDAYSPSSSSVRNIYGNMQKEKVLAGQTENIVLNISDAKVTLEQVRKQFTDWPMEGLKQLFIIDKDGSLIKIF